MYSIYIVLIIIISLIALLGTIYAGRQSNNKAEDELTDSNVYQSEENNGKRSNTSIKLLSMIYGVTFLITVVIIAIFIF